MKDQRSYWDKRIIEWENSTYDACPAQKVSFIEKVAQCFREPVQYRKTLAYEIISALKPKRVLELGCGSGRFALALINKAGVNHVTGVDIANEAINLARVNAKAMNLTGRLAFVNSSIADLDFKTLGSFDYVVGLGLIPYLTEKEFVHLFNSIKDTPFFFDVHSSKFSLNNLLHACYRSIKGHPFYIQYSKKEILKKFANLGITGVAWKKSGKVDYIEKNQ